MHPHEALVRDLLARLADRDAEGAARCYHPGIFYSDPLYPQVRGAAVAELWRLRFARQPGMSVAVEQVSGDADGALARWRVRYVEGGRPVELRVRSMFGFRGGRIARHYDHFSFWGWAAQAHGALGAALGWFAPFKWKVRRDATRALERFTDARA